MISSTHLYKEKLIRDVMLKSMKTNGNDKSLESYKIFPYIAWTITFIFAYFVYTITTDLQMVVRELQVQTQQLQEKVNTPAHEIEDFEL